MPKAVNIDDAEDPSLAESLCGVDLPWKSFGSKANSSAVILDDGEGVGVVWMVFCGPAPRC